MTRNWRPVGQIWPSKPPNLARDWIPYLTFLCDYYSILFKCPVPEVSVQKQFWPYDKLVVAGDPSSTCTGVSSTAVGRVQPKPAGEKLVNFTPPAAVLLQNGAEDGVSTAFCSKYSFSCLIYTDTDD